LALGAGKYQHRARFERRPSPGADRYGNQLAKDWQPVLTVWAAFRPEFGREAIAAGRPEATLRGVMTVRRSGSTDTINTDDRVVFQRAPFAGLVFQITSILPVPGSREIEMTLVSGVAETGEVT
jgi:head-tail adaptor